MRIIDLTMPINEDIPVWAENRKPQFEQVASIEKGGWTQHDLHISTHHGTHVDAPWHCIQKGKRLGEISLDKLVGEGIVIDCRKYAEIPEDAIRNTNVRNRIVFFYTGHSLRPAGEYVKDWPVISDELAKTLVKNNVKCIGVDTLSPDNEPYNVHRILLEKEIPIIENLLNLDKLLRKKFQAIILPLKVDLDGAPCRVIAIL